MIISIAIVKQQARNAAECGLAPERACPYPADSEAAVLFHAEYAAVIDVLEQAA